MSICKACSAKEIKAVDFSNQHHRFFDEIKKDVFLELRFSRFEIFIKFINNLI